MCVMVRLGLPLLVVALVMGQLVDHGNVEGCGLHLGVLNAVTMVLVAGDWLDSLLMNVSV